MHWRNILVLLTFSLLVFIPGISSIPPLDRDESRFAQASKQMIETGDYIDIRFQETPRYKKPAGAYWIQAAAVNILSPDKLNSIWAYRIPSLLASLAAVILTYAIACLFIKKQAALFSGILLASSFLVNAEAHMAKTDALLLVSLLITQYGLAKTYKGDMSFLSWLYFWGGLGFGILLKGPVVPVIIALTIVALWCFDRNLNLIKQLRPMTGILIAAAISLPWIIAVQISSNGTFLKKSIGVDLLPKLMGGVESHGMPPGYYLLILILTFWPGSLLL
ncbi:MAG: ArnT family glycosyltransferase, partial [Thalassobaculaceae bacterium]